MVATCQATCAQLLVVLGRVHAEAAGQALGSMLEGCFNPEANNPPEGLTEHVAESLCKVAAASGCASNKSCCHKPHFVMLHTLLPMMMLFHTRSGICLVWGPPSSLRRVLANILIRLLI